MKLHGTEEITLELEGWIPTDRAREIIGNELEVITKESKTPIRLQVSRLINRGSEKLPFASLNYSQGVWRIGVKHGGISSWFIPLCDTDSSLGRLVNAKVFKLEVRKADFLFMEKRKSLVTHHRPITGGEMMCHVELGPEQPPCNDLKPTYIRSKGSLYQIPQSEEPAAFRRSSRVDVVKDDISVQVFGVPVDWSSICLVERGRVDYSESAERVM